MRAWRPERFRMVALIIRCGFIDGWRKEMEFEVERERGTAWPLFLWLFASPLAATAPPPPHLHPSKVSVLDFGFFSFLSVSCMPCSCTSSPPTLCLLILPPKPRPSGFPSPLLWRWLERHRASLQGWDQGARPCFVLLVTPPSLSHLTSPSSHPSCLYITPPPPPPPFLRFFVPYLDLDSPSFHTSVIQLKHPQHFFGKCWGAIGWPQS